MINRYHSTVRMVGGIAALARQLLQRACGVNVVQELVAAKNLQARSDQQWIRLNSQHVLNFPYLTLDFFKDMAVGVYQVKLYILF